MSSPSDRVYRPDQVEVVETGDGSHTLFDRERDVHYSSLHGAVDESRHIFVEGTGLSDRQPPWHVLELGFGAGINFVETCRALRSHTEMGKLIYHAVDYAPVSPESVEFHEMTDGSLVTRVLAAVDLERPTTVEVASSDERIELHLHPQSWLKLDLPDFRADAVYYDPFGPKSEPDSWTSACFEVAKRHMRAEALLGTYSAATRVKRAMFEAGFSVASASGPGPKREITFASRDPKNLSAYDILNRADYLDHADI